MPSRDTAAARTLAALSAEARACTVCAPHLPRGPRPVFLAAATARVLIVGQAPGTRVHETGLPWNDASGGRLRDWLGLSPQAFYDTRRIAIVPTGLCYPGRGRSGDLPPRPECAPLWQPRFRAALPRLALTLLVGRYAQDWWLGARAGRTLADTVRGHAGYAPGFFPLPHPSPRNTLWLRRRPWFEREVLPALRERLRRALDA